MIRPAQELGDLVRDAAADAGMTITDFVADILAKGLARPDLSPELMTVNRLQKELPLQNTA